MNSPHHDAANDQNDLVDAVADADPDDLVDAVDPDDGAMANAPVDANDGDDDADVPAPEPVAPEEQPQQFPLALVAKFESAWTKQLDRQGGTLYCFNPRCAHLCTRKIDGGFTYKDKECATTVEVEIDGNTVTRYRFQPDDRIYLGCRGAAVANDANETHRIDGCLVCGECHDAGPIPMHQGCLGECLGCAGSKCNANPDYDASARAGRGKAVAGRTVQWFSKADACGPRLTAVETLNRSTYESERAIDELREEQGHLLRATKETGGEAQRKAELARRHAEAAAAREARNAALDERKATCEKLKGKLERANESLKLLRDDNHEGENDQTIEDVLRRIASLEQRLEEANKQYELVLREPEPEAHEPGNDYVDAVDKPAGAPDDKSKRKSKRKRVSEMNERELAAHRQTLEENRETRKKEREANERKLKNYDAVVRNAKRFVVAKRKLAERQKELEDTQQELVSMETTLKDQRSKLRRLNNATLQWLGDPAGKPQGWDGPAVQMCWSAFLKSQRDRAQASAAAGGDDEE